MYKFGKRTVSEEKERKEIEDRVREESELAIKSAQECLRDTKFEKYRIEYENLEKAMIEQLIYLDKTETDPIKYGFKAKDIISKYRHIGSLLRGVSEAAHKQI